MNKKTQTLTITILVIFVGLTLIAIGLMRANFDYYMTIEQLKNSPSTSSSAGVVRVLGGISPDSWKSVALPGVYTFVLEDQDQTLPVEYTGAPINVAADRSIVVEGRYSDNGTFISKKIMTKCESKYSANPKGDRQP